MRFGLLGPAEGDVVALGRAADFVRNAARVHRAMYLGNDGALERALAAWGTRLAGRDVTDEAAWTRAAQLALEGSPHAIDRFVATERARLRLRALEPVGDRRVDERVGNRAAVIVPDEADLRDEDLRASTRVLYGKGDAAYVRKIGARWFVSPGPLGPTGSGIAVLEDDRNELVVTISDADGNVGHREVIPDEPRVEGKR